MTKETGFNSVQLGRRFRETIIRPEERQIFISQIPEDEVEGSSYAYINCQGFGMVRRSITQRSDWPDIDVLPELTSQKLGISEEDSKWTQIFRVGACNFRCWYCFVDFRYLKADMARGEFKSPADLLDMYQDEQFQPRTLYLTGGQPDLVPEWTLWTLDEIEKRNMTDSHFLWQDDNLSSMFLFTELKADELKRIASYPNYARATCIKGISPKSFNLNTGASPDLFDLQIESIRKLVDSGIDVYTYITLLSDSVDDAKTEIPNLMDRLQQEIHHNMPLRVFPSKVVEYHQTAQRINPTNQLMLDNQQALLSVWQDEMNQRFSQEELSLKKHEVNLA